MRKVLSVLLSFTLVFAELPAVAQAGAGNRVENVRSNTCPSESTRVATPKMRGEESAMKGDQKRYDSNDDTTKQILSEMNSVWKWLRDHEKENKDEKQIDSSIEIEFQKEMRAAFDSQYKQALKSARPGEEAYYAEAFEELIRESLGKEQNDTLVYLKNLCDRIGNLKQYWVKGYMADPYVDFIPTMYSLYGEAVVSPQVRKTALERLREIIKKNPGLASAHALAILAQDREDAKLVSTVLVKHATGPQAPAYITVLGGDLMAMTDVDPHYEALKSALLGVEDRRLRNNEEAYDDFPDLMALADWVKTVKVLVYGKDFAGKLYLPSLYPEEGGLHHYKSAWQDLGREMGFASAEDPALKAQLDNLMNEMISLWMERTGNVHVFTKNNFFLAGVLGSGFQLNLTGHPSRNQLDLHGRASTVADTEETTQQALAKIKKSGLTATQFIAATLYHRGFADVDPATARYIRNDLYTPFIGKEDIAKKLNMDYSIKVSVADVENYKSFEEVEQWATKLDVVLAVVGLVSMSIGVIKFLSSCRRIRTLIRLARQSVKSARMWNTRGMTGFNASARKMLASGYEFRFKNSMPARSISMRQHNIMSRDIIARAKNKMKGKSPSQGPNGVGKTGNRGQVGESSPQPKNGSGTSTTREMGEGSSTRGNADPQKVSKGQGNRNGSTARQGGTKNNSGSKAKQGKNGDSGNKSNTQNGKSPKTNQGKNNGAVEKGNTSNAQRQTLTNNLSKSLSIDSAQLSGLSDKALATLNSAVQEVTAVCPNCEWTGELKNFFKYMLGMETSPKMQERLLEKFLKHDKAMDAFAKLIEEKGQHQQLILGLMEKAGEAYRKVYTAFGKDYIYLDVTKLGDKWTWTWSTEVKLAELFAQGRNSVRFTKLWRNKNGKAWRDFLGIGEKEQIKIFVQEGEFLSEREPIPSVRVLENAEAYLEDASKMILFRGDKKKFNLQNIFGQSNRISRETLIKKLNQANSGKQIDSDADILVLRKAVQKQIKKGKVAEKVNVTEYKFFQLPEDIARSALEGLKGGNVEVIAGKQCRHWDAPSAILETKRTTGDVVGLRLPPEASVEESMQILKIAEAELGEALEAGARNLFDQLGVKKVSAKSRLTSAEAASGTMVNKGTETNMHWHYEITVKLQSGNPMIINVSVPIQGNSTFYNAVKQERVRW